MSKASASIWKCQSRKCQSIKWYNPGTIGHNMINTKVCFRLVWQKTLGPIYHLQTTLVKPYLKTHFLKRGYFLQNYFQNTVCNNRTVMLPHPVFPKFPKIINFPKVHPRKVFKEIFWSELKISSFNW